MHAACAPLAGVADRSGAAAWLVLDLAEAPMQPEGTEALAGLVADVADLVDGITVLVAPGATVEAGHAAVLPVGDRASAERLARAEAHLPGHVGVVVYGDRRLLGAAVAASVARGLALLDDGDAAVAGGVAVTDSLRRVDDHGRLVECVNPTELLALAPPHTLRREVVAEVVTLAAGTAASSVEAGLIRAPWPVRVFDRDAAWDDRTVGGPAPAQPRAG